MHANPRPAQAALPKLASSVNVESRGSANLPNANKDAGKEEATNAERRFQPGARRSLADHASLMSNNHSAGGAGAFLTLDTDARGALDGQDARCATEGDIWPFSGRHTVYRYSRKRRASERAEASHSGGPKSPASSRKHATPFKYSQKSRPSRLITREAYPTVTARGRVQRAIPLHPSMEKLYQLNFCPNEKVSCEGA